MGKIRLGGIEIPITADASKLDAQLAQIRKKFNKVGRNLQRSGAGFNKAFTAPLIAVGGAALLAADSVEKAYAQIRRGTGETGKVLKGLQTDFIEVLKQVPESTGQVATAIADLNTRLNLQGDSLQGLAKQTLELSRVTDSNLSTVIAQTTRVFADQSIAAADYGNSLDFLFKVAQGTGITLEKLATQTVNYGVPLRQLGFTFEETATLIGRFEKEGVNLETVFAGLKQGLGNFAEAGKVPAEEFEKVVASIKAADEANGILIATQVFGKRAASDMAAAIREGRFDIDEMTEAFKRSKESIAQAAAETVTISDRLGVMKNALTLALEPLGSELLKAAEPLIKDLSSNVLELAQSFRDLSPETKEFIVKGGLILASIGPIVTALGIFVVTAGALVTPLGLATLAVAAFGTAAVVAADQLEGLWEVYKQFTNEQAGIDFARGLNTLHAFVNESLKLDGSTFTQNWETAVSKAMHIENEWIASRKKNQTEGEKLVQGYERQADATGKIVDAINDKHSELNKVFDDLGVSSKEVKKLLDKQSGALEYLSKKADEARVSFAGLVAEQNQKDLEKALQQAIDDNNGTDYEALTEKLKQSVNKGFTKELNDQFADAIPDHELNALADRMTSETLDPYFESWKEKQDAVIEDGLEKQKRAHRDSVDFWQNTFQNAITGTTFDLEDAFEQVATGFASELAASVFGGINGVSSPQDLGKLLSKELANGITSLFSSSGGGIPGLQGGAALVDGQIVGSASGGDGGLSTGAALATFGIVAAIAGLFSAREGYKREKEENPYGSADDKRRATDEAFIEGFFGAFGIDFGNDLFKFFQGTAKYGNPIGLLPELTGDLAVALGLFGTTDRDTQIRKGIRDVFTDAIKEATGGAGLTLFNPFGDGPANLTQFEIGSDNKFNLPTQFSEGGNGFDFFNSLNDEAKSTFSGLAAAFAQIFDIPEEFDLNQFSALLSENLLGDIDNAKILVKQLGLSFEELKAGILEAAELGEISWLEFNTTVAGLGKAFEPGLEGIGNVEKGVQQLIDSGGRGIAAVEGLKNIAYELAEEGGSFADLRDRLLETGLSVEEVDKIMTALANREVVSLDQLIDGDNEALGAIVGDLEAMGFGFAEIGEEVKTVGDQLKELDALELRAKELKVRVVVDDPNDALGDANPTLSDPHPPPSGGNVRAFAAGGIITGRTAFRHAGGLGIAGEAGAEAILPLKRGRGGDLGVQVSGGGKGVGGVTIQIDARGADPGVEARIMDALSIVERNAINQAVATMQDLDSRGRL